ncbi:agmatine deiminase family protein [Undibacterium sp. RuTC16W]|uniref:agmatine deiminase family protein n=1 Tax=Undibacterium sp. RuTC16W TaxID=3413048 RepID=UPI003BF2BCAE
MISRRNVLKTGLLAVQAAVCAAGSGLSGNVLAAAATAWRMPDESEPHAATWMGFGASNAIWGSKLKAGARDSIALIARTIAQFEPVNLLVKDAEYDIASSKCGASVNLVVQDLDDLWLRDTGPVFVKSNSGMLAGIDFNFNGWGEKQTYGKDTYVADAITQQVGAKRLQTQLTLEGGGIEVDGRGNAIITESCVLNANRNPGMSKATVEAELKRLLGLQKIIWLKGIRGKDITDGHTDFYARFVSPGVVVAGYDPDPASYDHAVTLNNIATLRNATDANGRKLQVIVLPAPSTVRPKYESAEFAAGYINFYVCNDAVIAPQFGDAKADANARSILREQFPNREIVQLNIDAIAAGGGGIHCTTQQQPAP